MKNDVAKEDLATTIMQIVREQKPQTVAELVRIAKEETSVDEQGILEVVLTLKDNGKIAFSEPSQSASSPARFGTYLGTGRALWFLLTLITTAVTTAIVLTIPENLYPWIYLRNALGIIFVLWLPGYAFIKGLFPEELPIKTAQKSLDTIERIALSLGMSLALVPITGLLLNYTRWGIRPVPITLSLLALTLICATVAVAREHQIYDTRIRWHAQAT